MCVGADSCKQRLESNFSGNYAERKYNNMLHCLLVSMLGRDMFMSRPKQGQCDKKERERQNHSVPRVTRKILGTKEGMRRFGLISVLVLVSVREMHMHCKGNLGRWLVLEKSSRSMNFRYG